MKQNKGFTLVELIVAITILAIIVAPMLRLFVSAANINSRSRKNSEAVSIAENIMEGTKAYDVDALTYRYNYPDGNFDIISYGSGSGFLVDTSNAGSVTQLSYAGGPLAPCTSTTFTPEGEIDFTPDADGKYYYAIKNIALQSIKYDAFITVDASPYRTGGSSALDVNSSALVDLKKLEKGMDATYLQSDTLDDIMITSLGIKGMEECGTGYALDATNPYKNLYRRIVIDITKSGEDVVCNVNYEYTAKNVPTMPDISIDPKNVLTKQKKDFASLMLIYKPIPTSVGGDIHDEIIINNNDDVDFEVYIAKQDMTDAEEYTYKVNVSVNEGSTKDKPSTVIRTNIDDLAAGTSKAVYHYNGMSGEIVKNRLLSDESVTKVTKDRLYDVNIKIFKSSDISGYDYSSADVIYELKGSTQE